MSNDPSFRPLGRGPQQLELHLIVGFVVCYILCAAFFQLRTRTVPWLPGSPVEYFTGSMLWMLSLVCLLLAEGDSAERKKALFWLAACGALLFLAFDELFEIHEVSERRGWFDDDYIKVVQWLGAGWALNYIRRREVPSRTASVALIVGFLFQSLHILVETGDGFLFKFPHLSRPALKWCEEFFELLFLSSYLIGFFVILKDREKGWWKGGLMAKKEKVRKVWGESRNLLPGQGSPISGLLIGFIVVYILCAVAFQVRSSIPPGTEGAPIDLFTSRVLWMLGLVCLLIALKKLPDQGRALFWLAACAALTILAMDEVFAYHERTKKLLGDDDHIKVLSWLVAAGALYLIHRLEKPPPPVVRFLLAGYLFQTLWILVDIGDGDYYRLELSRHFRLWAEECLELLALASYLTSFLALYGRNLHIRRLLDLAPEKTESQ